MDKPPHTAQIERQAANAFRRAGWTVARQSRLGRPRADLAIRLGKQAYQVEVKRLSEPRPDRALPLLAQAVLQAQAAAANDPKHGRPMAVLTADHFQQSLVRAVEAFAREYAPGVAVGLVDPEGLRFLMGPGLDLLDLPNRAAAFRRRDDLEPPVAHLFSDLNQWLLKVLLAARIPADLLSAPRGEYANATQLAGAAQVSIMSAFRFLRQLAAEGFLHESSSVLRLVRIDQLLEQWQAANRRPGPEKPMRWILPGDAAHQLRNALRSFESGASRPSRRPHAAPRVCLGLFAAADALGLGFVRGAAPHVYLEKLDANALHQLGLVPAESGSPPGVIVRRPVARESVFRASVRRAGTPASDVLQVWLDVHAHPSRGAEQAEVIYRRVIRPMLKA